MMNTSFRASKIFLGKVGTAASFGFGVNAGARYSDSQSGHRFALKEAHTLSRPQVDINQVVEFASDGALEGRSTCAQDVDESDLLFGYSCFRAASSQSSSHITVPNASSSSSSSSVSSSSHSTSETEILHQPTSQRSDEDLAPPPCTAKKSSSIQTATAATHHYSPPQRILAQSQDQKHAQHTLPPPRTRQKKDNLHWQEGGEEDEKAPLPDVKQQLEEHCHVQQQQQCQEHCQEHCEREGAATWSSLLPKDQCTICSDLLAVPVVTACQHGYCGICFHDLQQAHRQVFPLDCPNCRTPLLQGEQPLDLPRDARIAHQVALFVEAQRALKEEGGAGGGSGEWEGPYRDWLERREKYFVMSNSPTPPLSSSSGASGSEESVDLELLDLDDLPSWHIPSLDTAAPAAASSGDRVHNGVLLTLGVAVAAWCCLMLASSSSRQQPPRSVLKELAMSMLR